MRLSAPTGSYVVDAFTRCVLVFCFLYAVTTCAYLQVYPSPNNSLQVVRYLMEEDATACKQQNTKKNRDLKYADR